MTEEAKREEGSRAEDRTLLDRLRRAALPALVFAITALVYAVVAGPRTNGPSENNHFAHLAESWLNGQLDVVGGRPPGHNDWACYDTLLEGACAPDALGRPRPSYRWYVSFPPFPAVLLLPAVAIFGREFSDPLFWAIFAGLAPAFLLVLLRRLRELGLGTRKSWEDLALVAVFAFGSVYFSTAVQGSVWFSAHIVASLLIVLFLHFALGARHPLLAGLFLGLAFLTRPTTGVFALFFLLEAMRAHRAASEPPQPEEASALRRAVAFVRGAAPLPVLRASVLFALPILACGGVAMWMNDARFGDPFEFGHAFLVIRWSGRIEKWGLFNFHYFAKNLAVFLAALPWLSAVAPFVKISRHGLAIWITSPNLYPAVWPGRVLGPMVALYVCVALAAFINLCYQNSGWVQFGYRFALDYLPALILLVALSRRRFGAGFFVLLALAIAVNLFGAITFDRAGMFYDDDGTQERIFQPD